MITCMLTYLPLDKKVFSTNSSTPIIQTSNCFLIWSKNKKTKLTVPFGRHPKALASRFGANAQGFRVLMWSCGFFIRKTQLYTLCAIHLMLPIIIFFFYLQKKTEANRNELNSFSYQNKLTTIPKSDRSPLPRQPSTNLQLSLSSVPYYYFMSDLESWNELVR